ncbi:hypothetical protein NMY22_g872 [Coprinellus aureogranulatus]|nr:hypothetical protein NMY22_g872 [Coprinellus aureogranulatus]
MRSPLLALGGLLTLSTLKVAYATSPVGSTPTPLADVQPSAHVPAPTPPPDARAIVGDGYVRPDALLSAVPHVPATLTTALLRQGRPIATAVLASLERRALSPPAAPSHSVARAGGAQRSQSRPLRLNRRAALRAVV